MLVMAGAAQNLASVRVERQFRAGFRLEFLHVRKNLGRWHYKVNPFCRRLAGEKICRMGCNRVAAAARIIQIVLHIEHDLYSSGRIRCRNFFVAQHAGRLRWRACDPFMRIQFFV